MNELQTNIIERGKAAQRKTIEGIIEFAQCVAELKDKSSKSQGGTDFGKLAKEHWGINKASTSMWIKINDNKDKLFNFIKLFNSPISSYSKAYEIAITDDSVISLAIDKKLSLETRQDIIDFKRSLTQKSKPKLSEKHTQPKFIQEEPKKKSTQSSKNWFEEELEKDAKEFTNNVFKSLGKLDGSNTTQLGETIFSLAKDDQKKIFKFLKQITHPDKNPQYEEQFKIINQLEDLDEN